MNTVHNGREHHVKWRGNPPSKAGIIGRSTLIGMYSVQKTKLNYAATLYAQSEVYYFLQPEKAHQSS